MYVATRLQSLIKVHTIVHTLAHEKKKKKQTKKHTFGQERTYRKKKRKIDSGRRLLCEGSEREEREMRRSIHIIACVKETSVESGLLFVW